MLSIWSGPKVSRVGVTQSVLCLYGMVYTNDVNFYAPLLHVIVT